MVRWLWKLTFGKLVLIGIGGYLIYIVLVLCFPKLFAGILYPRIMYVFAPGYSIQGTGNEGFFMGFSESSDPFKKDISMTLYTREAHKALFIKEIQFEWEHGEYQYAVNYSRKLEMWDSDGSYLQHIGIFDRPDGKAVNFGRLFKTKKARIGDTFGFQVTMIYSLDDGPEIKQVIPYQVRAYEGSLNESSLGFVRLFIFIFLLLGGSLR